MFRFTIRELVLLTLVVAMGVGSWLDRSSVHQRLHTDLTDAQNAALELSVKLRREREARPLPPWEFNGFPGGNSDTSFPSHSPGR